MELDYYLYNQSSETILISLSDFRKLRFLKTQLKMIYFCLWDRIQYYNMTAKFKLAPKPAKHSGLPFHSSNASSCVAQNQHLPANLPQTSSISPVISWHQMDTTLQIWVFQPNLTLRLINRSVHDIAEAESYNYHWLKLKMKYEQNTQKNPTFEQLAFFKLGHVSFPPGHPQRRIL